MTTPNIKGSRVISLTWSIVGMITTAFLAGLATYFATTYANRDSFVNEKAMRYFDYQMVKSSSVSSYIKIPGASLVYLDDKGKSVGPISNVQIDLHNFGDRDIENIYLQFDAVGRTEGVPTLYAYKVLNGNAEDNRASVKPTTKGGALSIELQLTSINRTEALAPARTIILYFNGNTPPDVTVSTAASGVTARSYDYQHYIQAQNARRPFLDAYKEHLWLAAGLFAWFVFTSYVVLWGRSREVRGLAKSVLPVEEVLKKQSALGSANVNHAEFAKEIVMAVWETTYANLSKPSQWLAFSPDKTKL